MAHLDNPIYRRFRLLLFDREITRSDLAREIGYDLSQVSRALSGTKRPSRRLAVAISRALGEPVQDLFPEWYEMLWPADEDPAIKVEPRWPKEISEVNHEGR